MNGGLRAAPAYDAGLMPELQPGPMGGPGVQIMPGPRYLKEVVVLLVYLSCIRAPTGCDDTPTLGAAHCDTPLRGRQLHSLRSF